MNTNLADQFCIKVIQSSTIDMKLRAPSVSATVFIDENVISSVR